MWDEFPCEQYESAACAARVSSRVRSVAGRPRPSSRSWRNRRAPWCRRRPGRRRRVRPGPGRGTPPRRACWTRCSPRGGGRPRRTPRRRPAPSPAGSSSPRSRSTPARSSPSVRSAAAAGPLAAGSTPPARRPTCRSTRPGAGHADGRRRARRAGRPGRRGGPTGDRARRGPLERGVPSSSNVTVTAPTTAGYVTVWPAGAARPTTSVLNFVPPPDDGERRGRQGVRRRRRQPLQQRGADAPGGGRPGLLPAGSSITPLVPARLLDTVRASSPLRCCPPDHGRSWWPSRRRPGLGRGGGRRQRDGRQPVG